MPWFVIPAVAVICFILGFVVCLWDTSRNLQINSRRWNTSSGPTADDHFTTLD